MVSLNLEIEANKKIDKENGIYSIYCNTIIEAKTKTPKDFIDKNDTPIWWDKNLNMSKLEVFNR